jgi:hypothetical protein
MRAQLRELEQEIERRKRLQRERVSAQVIERPPTYITRVLGERPFDPERRAVWEQTSAGIERYRQHRGLTGGDTALGADPTRSTTARRASRQTLGAVLEARKRLGLTRDESWIGELRPQRQLERGGLGLEL